MFRTRENSLNPHLAIGRDGGDEIIKWGGEAVIIDHNRLLREEE